MKNVGTIFRKEKKTLKDSSNLDLIHKEPSPSPVMQLHHRVLSFNQLVCNGRVRRWNLVKAHRATIAVKSSQLLIMMLLTFTFWSVLKSIAPMDGRKKRKKTLPQLQLCCCTRFGATGRRVAVWFVWC